MQVSNDLSVFLDTVNVFINMHIILVVILQGINEGKEEHKIFHNDNSFRRLRM